MYINMVAYHHPSVRSIDKHVESSGNAVCFQQSVKVHKKIKFLLVMSPIYRPILNEKKYHQSDNFVNQWLKAEND